jgi:D-alanine--D-alanine ligase
MPKPFKIAVLCGGPSLERGISLNSSRSVCDHLQGGGIKIIPIYFDHQKRPYPISISQLYSNTPSDFDFKLSSSGPPLSRRDLGGLLRSVDLAFPVMHGKFGEDGKIQELLEKANIPYVGSDSIACSKCFDKYRAHLFLKEHGFQTIPSLLIEFPSDGLAPQIEEFFKTNEVQRAVVKPAAGGSSIGVYQVASVDEAVEKARYIFRHHIDNRVVVEPFCEGGEFSVIVLQNSFDLPVALLPTEIELLVTEDDDVDTQIFDFRKKYLATNQLKRHCPARFDVAVIEAIQTQAEQLFHLLGMRDFGRFDGWALHDGSILFSADFNPVSGMEQNSVLFQQISRVGMSHRDALRFIVKNACRRYNIDFPERDNDDKTERQRVHVLFGGATSERQVSLMSGTNVWLKLRRSKKYKPEPFLLDLQNRVWELPYAYTLSHTVEEIQEACAGSVESEQRVDSLRAQVLARLGAEPSSDLDGVKTPRRMSLPQFISRSKVVFNCLHGGIGEDGTMQSMFDEKAVRYSGSGVFASQLCMDKYQTGKTLEGLQKCGIYTAVKVLLSVSTLMELGESDFKSLWRRLRRQCDGQTLIVKPRADGCSTGIARLYKATDLFKYVQKVLQRAKRIKKGTLTKQHGIIEMPTAPISDLLFEPFVETDRVRVVKNQLKWKQRTGWIEITVGILGDGNRLRALNPSLTVSEGNIVTLEEKFQSGTGINITPPPTPQVARRAIRAVKTRMVNVANTLGISGYARIDAFMETSSGKLIVIEANTCPGLTPSTVIYQQALAERPKMYPIEFLEKILDLSLKGS